MTSTTATAAGDRHGGDEHRPLVALGAAGRRRPTRTRFVRSSRRVRAFIASRRIDMASLAASLGVDRTSLFRWVGNRDALLSEVLWSLAIPTLVQAEHANADLAGGERVAGILTHFVDDLITAEYFRQFLRREPSRALRLLTTKESPIQRRHVATAEWLVRRDLGDAPLGGAIDPRRARLPAGPHVGVVHVRGPHLGRYAERRARARRLPAPAARRRMTAAPGRRRSACACRSRPAGTTTTSTAI